MELSLIEREVISYSCKNLLFCCFGFGVFLGNSHYILGKFYSLTVVSLRSTCVIPSTYQHYQINSKTATANQCFSADCFQGSSACNGRVLAT